MLDWHALVEEKKGSYNKVTNEIFKEKKRVRSIHYYYYKRNNIVRFQSYSE